MPPAFLRATLALLCLLPADTAPPVPRPIWRLARRATRDVTLTHRLCRPKAWCCNKGSRAPANAENWTGFPERRATYSST